MMGVLPKNHKLAVSPARPIYLQDRGGSGVVCVFIYIYYTVLAARVYSARARAHTIRHDNRCSDSAV